MRGRRIVAGGRVGRASLRANALSANVAPIPGASGMDTVESEAARVPLGVRREPFTFTGTPREYFGIWIVNVLLTILTLGIYSAWAKVRRQRYFYGNTWLAGANFEYHARPVQILIGRIIVLALLAAYNVALQFFPIFGLAIGLLLLGALPWLVMRGMRFTARVTSYRTIRFDFTGTYWGAFRAYILGGLVIYLSAGILAPLASQWIWNYRFSNLRYGDRPISCEPRLEKMFAQWWMPAIVFVGGALVTIGLVVLVVAATFSGFGEPDVDADSPGAGIMVLAMIYFAFVPFILLYAFASLLYTAGTRNVAFNETVIDGRHMLASSIARWRYAWIAVSNFFATVFTLGLARPWAAIRMARYLALVTALDATGSLDDYFGTMRDSGAAVGSEFMDVEGFDVGF